MVGGGSGELCEWTADMDVALRVVKRMLA